MKYLANGLAIFFCVLCVGQCLAENSFLSKQTSPNVILIMSDDQGWGDVGFNGNKVVQTPNLDQMAADGVRFDRFYAASP